MKRKNEICKKILVINTNPMIFDGIMTSIFHYIEYMDKSDVAIDFIAVNDVEKSILERIRKMGARVYIFTYRTGNPLKYIYQISKLIRKNKYALVHVHGSSCIMALELLASKLANAPCCPHSHNTSCQHKMAHRLLKPIFHILYRNGFACSLEAGYWLYGKRRKFDVICNGLPTEKFKFERRERELYREKYGLMEYDIGIICIAHFTEVKNHIFLIEVFKKLTEKKGNYKLFLLGQGESRVKIEELVREYGIQEKVVFVGMTRNVSQFLSACDLMVLPSLYEGFPFTVIEAQASGIKCLLSEKITRKCKFSDNLEYLKLDEELWVSKIIEVSVFYDRQIVSEQNISNIEKAGYDIRKDAAFLKELYIKYSR